MSVDMTVTQMFSRPDEKFAYVAFSDGDKSAEGKVPACKITNNHGFTSDEVEQLEEYMRAELDQILSEARKINVMKAFMA